ncbi:MAG: EAL domain-containing protein [Lachnospiraceae bacterium]|nr:EAL domain-containing protein [Lachnospiraceae bacterium]
MTYEAAFAIAALLITCQIVISYNNLNRVSNFPSRMFLVMVVNNGLTALTGVIRWAALRYLDPCPGWIPMACSMLYFITHTLVILFIFLYILSTIKVWRELSWWVKCFILVPICITMLVILTNPFTQAIFYYYPDGVYHRGSGILIIYANFIYYLALTDFILIWYRRSFSAMRRAIFLLILTIGTGSAIVQMFIPDISVEVCACSVCALILFLFVQNPKERIDGELNVLSSQAFSERIKYDLLSGKRFDIVGLLFPELSEIEHQYGADSSLALLHEIVSYLQSLGEHTRIFRVERNCLALQIIRPLPGETEEVIRDIRRRFGESWAAGEKEVTTGVRILHMLLPRDTRDDQLLTGVVNRFAKTGKEERVMTTLDFDLESIGRRRKINGALIRAMENNNFELRYTPVYSQAVERIIAAEVSLRFFDEELGYVYDDELFRFAQRSGHVLQLGELIFEHTCRLIRREKLDEQGLSFLAVSLHPAMCLQYRLIDRLREIATYYEIEPGMICLMLSEYTVSTATQSFKQSVTELQKTGVRICLEDYGSGFTNISSIFEMPFSVLKINRSVIRAALKNDKARITMDSTLKMARELDMMTMVEGIDDEAYFEMIRDMACDLAKGNFFYEQLVEDEFLRVIHMKAGGEETL